MTVSAISSGVPAVIAPEVHKPASAPVASESSGPVVPQPPSSPSDTVTLSSASRKAPPAGDVDHDGDSH